MERLQAKLEEEQRRCSETQIELDAQRQVNADIMMQIEDQSALYRTVHAEVTLAPELHVSTIEYAICVLSPFLCGHFCVGGGGGCGRECMHT